MAERVLGTGVELRHGELLDDLRAGPGEVAVEAQVFTDVDDDGRRFRVGGPTCQSEGWIVPTGSDPSSALVEIAHEAREMHMGDLLGNMRIGGCDVTRFEFYAAPFRIELADELRETLVDSWDERPPRRGDGLVQQEPGDHGTES